MRQSKRKRKKKERKKYSCALWESNTRPIDWEAMAIRLRHIKTHEALLEKKNIRKLFSFDPRLSRTGSNLYVGM